MPGLDNMEPEMGGELGANASAGPANDDREGAMAKADLYKLANYSHKLFQQIDDGDQLEAWVQAKITKAADYIASVYHYLEYEMKFSEYGKALDDSDVLSESQKQAMKNRLMEARMKIKELKTAQAEKISEGKVNKKVQEGILSGGESTCHECGGTGVVMMPAASVPEAVKEKVAKYNRKAKAFHAASKRLDRNHNGIPDDEEIDEDTTEKSATGGTITRGKGFTRHTHNPARFSDEPHAEPASKAKAQSAADKAGGKAADKAEEKEGKNWEKRFGKGSVTRVKDGKKVEEEVAETSGNIYGQGVYEGKKKGDGNLANNAKPYDKVTRGDVIAGRLGKDEKGGKAKKVDEAAKPSADLTKKEKSAVVKKAKAGEDIGKPGKGFKKVEAAAKKSGAKDPKAVAAAAMWKNIKESVTEGSIQNGVWVASPDKGVPAPSGDPEGVPAAKKPAAKKPADKAPVKKAEVETDAPAVAESSDMERMREQMARLNRNEKIAVNESAEIAQLKKLTKLLG